MVLGARNSGANMDSKTLEKTLEELIAEYIHNSHCLDNSEIFSKRYNKTGNCFVHFLIAARLFLDNKENKAFYR